MGKFADNKYKTKLVLPAGAPEAQAFVKTIDAAAIEIHGAKGAKLYKPYVIDEDANTVTFIFKTNFEPTVFDARNNAVKGVRIGGGSVLRLMGNFVEFEKGISAQFNQVQIKELNGAGSSAFDAIEDGYEFDASDVRETVASQDAPTTMTDAPNAALDI